MLSTTERTRRESPRSLRAVIPRYRSRSGGDDTRLKTVTRSESQYEKRKAAALCTSTGCTAAPDVGNTHCGRHLREMSKRNKELYQERLNAALCIYCGTRPQFWGVRCVICRQRFAKHPLPFGARRALRLFREAEEKHERERIQVEARHAARKLLASEEIDGKYAEALRFYAGVDNGQWRTYSDVGQLMHISKERVRQLLLPSKIVLARILDDKVPWIRVREVR